MIIILFNHMYNFIEVWTLAFGSASYDAGPLIVLRALSSIKLVLINHRDINIHWQIYLKEVMYYVFKIKLYTRGSLATPAWRYSFFWCMHKMYVILQDGKWRSLSIHNVFIVSFHPEYKTCFGTCFALVNKATNMSEDLA